MDAVGTLDSVTVIVHPDGHAHQRTNRQIDFELGERYAPELWNDTFDVRLDGGNYAEFTTLVNKGSISANLICQTNLDFELLIHAKHQPVKVSWDPTDFQYRCQQESFLTNNGDWRVANMPDYMFGEPVDPELYSWVCLPVDSQYTVNTTYLNREWMAIQKEAPLIDGDTAMVTRLFAGFRWIVIDAPCLGVYQGPPTSTIDHAADLGARISSLLSGDVLVGGLDPGSYVTSWTSVHGQRLTASTLIDSWSASASIVVPLPRGVHGSPVILTIRDVKSGRQSSAVVVAP